MPIISCAWEQRKLEDITKYHNAGIYVEKSKYGKGKNIIGVSNIYDNDVVDGTVYSVAPVADEKYILHNGDLLYGESSLVLKGIAKTMCVNSAGDGTAFAWHTRRFTIDQQICSPYFLMLELNYDFKLRKYFMSVATQTALTGITTSDYFRAEITFPSVVEQRAIGKLIKIVFKLIAANQCQQKRRNLLKFTRLFKNAI
ncbi:MAG: restriction endonuclease subunit S [Lentilactobacillus diolivorans]|uniref:restriction endonuclease subunit S n=1 Tax=Lentilactobacillus diolivorans TaxID=179838 RepID=UPI0039EB83C9